MGWFESIISMDGQLQGKARSNRRLLFVMSAVLTVVQTVTFFVSGKWPFMWVGYTFLMIPQVVTVLMCLCRADITHTIVRFYILGMGAGIIVTDYNTRTIGATPLWPTFVLLADLALMIGLGRRFVTGLIAATALWVILTSTEMLLRFGLFDLPGSAPYWYRRDRLATTLNCAYPPCQSPPSAAWHEAEVSLVVLLFDFLATRGFAESAEKEKAAMARTIETVEAIAQLLAGYDVDTVAGMLQEAEAEGRLPVAMHGALRMLEQNLRAYRPYLPKSCLPVHNLEYSVDCSSVSSSVSHSTVPSRSASDQATDGTLAVLPKVLGALKTTRDAVLVVNTSDTLACLAQSPGTFTSFFEMLMDTTMSAVESRCGLVDVFVGDRILASFNTSRPCITHATAAAGAAQHIVREVRSKADGCGSASSYSLRVDIGVASGHMHCGDTGCADMRRFSLLGVLPVLACGMERAARAFGLDVVCNTALRKDTEHQYELLLVPRLVCLVKARDDGKRLRRMTIDAQDTGTEDSRDARTCKVYELVCPDKDGAPSPEGEWMYHIGKAAAQWDPYNAAMRAYLSGASALKAAEMAGEHHRKARNAIGLLGDTAPLDVHV